MKVAVLFTGAGSTGKTTMLNTLYNYFVSLGLSVSIISEFIRNLIKKGVLSKVDVNADDYNQIIITSELLLQFFEKFEENLDLLIAERSPIDTLAYSRHRKDFSEYINCLNERFLKIIVDYCNKNYEVLCFYFPPVLPFEEDGIRDREGQKIIDNEILNILKEFNIKYITVSETSFGKRFDFIKDKILEYFQISSRV